MPSIQIATLVPHPRNQEFFDDIKGDAWDDFLLSIQTSGVTNAITIDQNNTIISGHQRVRACRLLGINEVEFSRIVYSDEELSGDYPKDVKDLIESNLKQRVAGNPNPIKLGRCFAFLEGYYGIQNGGDRKSEQKNFALKSQKDLADEYGVTAVTIQNYKRLAAMIPEMQDLVDTGIVTKTAALAIIKQLSEDEQRQLVQILPKDQEKLSSRELEFYKNRVQELTAENDKLKSSPVETIEVVPSDYEELKSQATKASQYEKEYSILEKDFQSKVRELNEVRKQLETLQRTSPESQYSEKLKNACLAFCAGVSNFIEQYGGYVWLTQHINELPNLEREGYIKAINAIKNWADTMNYNINNITKEII